jgi:hypothetical protein
MCLAYGQAGRAAEWQFVQPGDLSPAALPPKPAFLARTIAAALSVTWSLVKMADLVADRLLAESQACGDSGVGLAGRDQIQHVVFPLGKVRERGCDPAGGAREERRHPRGQGSTEDDSPAATALMALRI